MAACLQPVGMETPAQSPGAGFATGGQRGRGAYLDTPIGTSHPQIFVGSTLEYLESERNKRRFKSIMQVVHSLARCDREDQARALMCCGKFFERINFPCGSYKLIPHYCDSVFCPNCAARRSKPLQQRILKRLNQTKYDYWHVTVTVVNWFTLTRKALSRLIRKFAELREMELWREYVRGGVYSIECTYSRERSEWHPHFHVMIETEKRLPMDWIFKLQSEWFRITGDSHVINLEEMYGVDKKGRKKRKVNMQAVRELVKYATKAASFGDSSELVDSFLVAFENVRRMQSFGSFLGVEKEAEKELEQTPGDFELVGCKCGLCVWGSGVHVRELVHISQTVLMFDGTRQLRLFDSGADPPVEVIPLAEDKQDGSAVAFRTVQKTLSLFVISPMGY